MIKDYEAFVNVINEEIKRQSGDDWASYIRYDKCVFSFDKYQGEMIFSIRFFKHDNTNNLHPKKNAADKFLELINDR
jgi:hypothetical protein